MLIALFVNTLKYQAKEIAFGIIDYLKERGNELVTEDENTSILGLPSLTTVSPEKIDFRLSLGGDGTILRLAHRHPSITAPLVGINMGSLGFLADVPIDDIYNCLNHLVDGRYEIEERIILTGHGPQNENSFAINDIVFHRAQNPSLIELGISVDGVYLNTFSADGIILSTPTGSTAYSLAAGGPIISPQLESIVITPINPHTISNRPLVLWPNSEIRVEYLSSLEPIEVNFDGVTRFHMKQNDFFSIRPSKQKFSLVTFPHHDYFSTLRTKLNWTGKLRIT